MQPDYEWNNLQIILVRSAHINIIMLDSTNLCALKEYHHFEKDNDKRKELLKISYDDKKSECEHYKRKCKFYVSMLAIFIYIL